MPSSTSIPSPPNNRNPLYRRTRKIQTRLTYHLFPIRSISTRTYAKLSSASGNRFQETTASEKWAREATRLASSIADPQRAELCRMWKSALGDLPSFFLCPLTSTRAHRPYDLEESPSEVPQVGNETRKEDEPWRKGRDSIYLHRFIPTEEIISASNSVSPRLTSTLSRDLIGPRRESITRLPLFLPSRSFTPLLWNRARFLACLQARASCATVFHVDRPGMR